MSVATLVKEQRISALRYANTIRTARREMKDGLRAGTTSARELLTEVPTHIRRMAVDQFLMAQPKLGRHRAGVICRRLNIRPSRYLGDLSPRLRAELILAVEALGGHGRPAP